MKTMEGKLAALAALQNRRNHNLEKKRVDNSKLPAGSPMYFDCIGCGQDIVVPETYLHKPDLCDECDAMKKLGWLE